MGGTKTSTMYQRGRYCPSSFGRQNDSEGVFGAYMQKKDKNGLCLDPVVFHAFQHVSGYKSAIKDYYSNMDLIFSSSNSLRDM
jgi:hypothetical protein